MRNKNSSSGKKFPPLWTYCSTLHPGKLSQTQIWQGPTFTNPQSLGLRLGIIPRQIQMSHRDSIRVQDLEIFSPSDLKTFKPSDLQTFRPIVWLIGTIQSMQCRWIFCWEDKKREKCNSSWGPAGLSRLHIWQGGDFSTYQHQYCFHQHQYQHHYSFHPHHHIDWLIDLLIDLSSLSTPLSSWCSGRRSAWQQRLWDWAATK